MNKQQLKNLRPGDIIRNRASRNAYIVTGNYGARVTAVRTIDITNPSEWDFVSDACHDGDETQEDALEKI